MQKCEMIVDEMYVYAVHGCTVQANRALDSLSAVDDEGLPIPTVDVRVQVVPLAMLQAQFPRVPWSQFLAAGPTRDEAGLGRMGAYPRVSTGAGDALVLKSYATDHHQFVALIALDGRAIHVGWQAATHIEAAHCELAISTYWLPTLLGIALRLQGKLVLHGNAIRIGDGALVWCGAKGAGKSTLAAAFVAAGYPLHADDQVVLTRDGDCAGGDFLVEAGIGQMRLWEDSSLAFSHFAGVAQDVDQDVDQAGMPELHFPIGPGIKGILAGRLPGSHSQGGSNAAANPAMHAGDALPLAGVCLLAPRAPGLECMRIERLAPLAALQGAMGSRFAAQSLDVTRAQTAREFAAFTQLARRVPVYRLTLPDRLDALPAVVADLVQLAGDPAGATAQRAGDLHAPDIHPSRLGTS